ncbi:MAG TPA: helix-turn-helix domain-containing protein [Pseudonocardiaceae bacterium]|nr:helix-turn-helix domain-containing protein [Pseudonocardiaceae bacterium]
MEHMGGSSIGDFAGLTSTTPDGRGLPPLPPSFWNSWQVREAAATSPGAVIAIARRAHGLHQGDLGGRAGFSQSTISRLEAGGNLGYDLRVLRALQRLLGVPPFLLGLADRAIYEPVAVVEPVSGPLAPATLTIHDICPAATAFAVGEVGEAQLTGVPIGPAIVAHLLVARRLINDAGSWCLTDAVLHATRQLYEIAEGLRRAAPRGNLRRRLLFVCAAYSELRGWLHERSGDLHKAGHWTARALQQAQAADNRDLVAYTYSRMSALAEAEGDVDRVIGLAAAAQREPGISPRVRAFALHQLARGFARRGEEAACLGAMDEAFGLVEREEPERSEEYVVGYWVNKYHVESERAGRLLDLGRTREGLAAYERVRPHWSAICPWLQAIHLAKIAVAQADLGDFDVAAATGFDALMLADGAGSPASVGELRRLQRWSGFGSIAQLNEALNTIH